MVATTLNGTMLTGNHGSRPAASAVAKGTLYACSTHALVYQSDASSWSTWLTATGTGYTAGGTDVALADGGTGASLSDPNADRILFWDDSAGGVTWLTAGTNLTITGTTIAASGGSGGTPILQLDYALAADVSNQALTGGTAFDIFANQNFTVSSASSLVEVSVRGYGFCNDNVSNQYMLRANIDSGGTPVLKYLTSASNNSGSAALRDNILAGGVVYVSGLSAATHTIKIQVIAVSNDHFYCRASTNGPTTGGEFLAVQVIEHI